MMKFQGDINALNENIADVNVQEALRHVLEKPIARDMIRPQSSSCSLLSLTSTIVDQKVVAANPVTPNARIAAP